MAENTMPGRPRWRRRQYVIDKSVQMGVAGQLLAGLGGVALLCAAALYVFLSGKALPGLDPLRRFLLVANATYFVLAAGILVLLTLLVTHRFAGPAFVMRRALGGMLQGDYTHRLSLRKKDYLKELADDIRAVRDQWMEHDAATRRTLHEMRRALEAGDEEAVRVLLGTLERALLVQTAADETPEPEHSPEPEPTLVA